MELTLPCLLHCVRGIKDSLARDFLHDEALDDIAFLDVVVAFQTHAALEASRHFLDVFLVVLQAAQLALEHDDILAQQANLRIALHLAVGDVAAGDNARARNLELIASSMSSIAL